MIFRGVWQVDGGHVTMQVFVAPGQDRTFAGIGELTMSVDDFASFRRSVQSALARPNDCWQFREREVPA